MKNSISMNALVMTASALAGQQGVDLVVDENAVTFATNGKKLVMPPVEVLQNRFPDPADLSAYLLGAVVHEAGHILHTDFEARKLWRRRYEGHPDQQIAEFVGQAIEDVIIERKQCRELSGAPMILVDMWALLHAEQAKRERPLQEDDRKCLARYLYASCRHTVLQQPWTEGALRFEEDHVRMTCAPALASAFAVELATLPLARTTAEGIAVADRLLLVMGIEPIDKDEPAEKTDEAKEQGVEQSPDPECSGEQGPGAPTVSAAASQEGTPEDGDGNAAAADEGVLALAAFVQADEEGEDDLQGECFAPGNGWATNATTAVYGAGHMLKQQVLGASMGASAKLVSLLLANSDAGYEYGNRGKVVATRLWKLRGGNMRVFKRQTDARELSTGIKILCDKSLSMRSSMRLVRQAAAFLPVAFEGIPGLHTSIDVFPGFNRSVDRIKRFDQMFDICADELAATEASGGTPMGAALRAAADDLLELEVDRRLLLVPTDGEPDRDEVPQSKVVLRQLTAAGIEVIGIGIGVDLRHLFSDFVRIGHVAELTDALYEVIERKMVALPLAA